VLKCEPFRGRDFKISKLSRAHQEKAGATLNKKPNDRSGLVMAMRAVTTKDIYLSLGLAAVVMTLTSVMGSM
jgi:hypothetical protein